VSLVLAWLGRTDFLAQISKSSKIRKSIIPKKKFHLKSVRRPPGLGSELKTENQNCSKKDEPVW
jgi:hypothetical protein